MVKDNPACGISTPIPRITGPVVPRLSLTALCPHLPAAASGSVSSSPADHVTPRCRPWR